MKRVPPILYPWALIPSHWIACIVPWACFPLISPPFLYFIKKKISTWNPKHLKLDSSYSFLLLLFFPGRGIKQLPKSRETKRPQLIGTSICQIGHPEQVLCIITIIEWCMTPLCYTSPCGHGESPNNIV